MIWVSPLARLGLLGTVNLIGHFASPISLLDIFATPANPTNVAEKAHVLPTQLEGRQTLFEERHRGRFGDLGNVAKKRERSKP